MSITEKFYALQDPKCPGVECDTWEEARAVVVKWQKEGHPARILMPNHTSEVSLWDDATLNEYYPENG